jgi:phosphoglycolate phosphatase
MNKVLLGQFEVDAVMLDLDGTLVDTLDDFVLALNAMLADLPPPYRQHRVERSSVVRILGKGSENLITSVLKQVVAQGAAGAQDDPPDALYQQAWHSYQRHYLAHNGQHAHVYPGVVAALEQLQDDGLKLACLTNKPIAFTLPLLKAKRLDRFFQQVFGGDSFERKKPDPLPLLKTCQALGSVPQRTLMIGDSSNDALAARAAGCPVLLVSYGYNHGEPIHAVDADAVVDSLQSLVRT